MIARSRTGLPALVFAVAGLLATTAWWRHVRNEIFVIVGNRNEAGGWYGFWSGFAGGVRVFEWFIIGGLFWWHNSCHHSRWCLRWGRYPAAGGVFRLCRHHHPDLNGAHPHPELIRRLHEEFRRAR